MKKDFVTVSPDTGGGSGTVNVTADPNLSFAERNTTLNFSADGGIQRAVDVLQFGNTIIPQFYLSPTMGTNSQMWGLKLQTNLELEEYSAGVYNFDITCTANSYVATEGTVPNVTFVVSVYYTIVIPSGSTNVNDRSFNMYYSKNNGTKTLMTARKDQYSKFVSFVFTEGATLEELTNATYTLWLRKISSGEETQVPVMFSLHYDY